MAQLAAVFDEDPAVIAAHKLARERFESWATNDVSDPQPDDPTDAIQLALMRWERARFGDPGDALHALGVIEELAETFLADEPRQAEEALDGLGDTCVYAAQICTANRMAIGPILDLARVLNARGGKLINVAWGVLAQTVLKGTQKIRGLDDTNRFRMRLCASVALCIARAIDDVEVMHDVRVNPARVLGVVAGEVLARGAGHDAIPKSVKLEESRAMLTPEEHARLGELREQAKHKRRAQAAERMADVLGDYDPATDAPRCMMCGADLEHLGDRDLFQCGANAEHTFTGKQVSAAGAETRVRAPDEEFDASDTKPE